MLSWEGWGMFVWHHAVRHQQGWADRAGRQLLVLPSGPSWRLQLVRELVRLLAGCEVACCIMTALCFYLLNYIIFHMETCWSVSVGFWFGRECKTRKNVVYRFVCNRELQDESLISNCFSSQICFINTKDQIYLSRNVKIFNIKIFFYVIMKKKKTYFHVLFFQWFCIFSFTQLFLLQSLILNCFLLSQHLVLS